MSFSLNTDGAEVGKRPVLTNISWHHFVHTLFGTTSNDGYFQLWDVRSKNKTNPSSSVKAHTDEVTGLTFSPFDETLLVTASKDRTLSLWDMRNLGVKIHSLTGHFNPIEKVSWCPDNENIVASKDSQRTLNLWDLSKIGSQVVSTDSNEKSEGVIGPPVELLFSHRGHSSRITDFAWCPSEPHFIGSVAEDNVCQIWRPSDAVLSLMYSK